METTKCPLMEERIEKLWHMLIQCDIIWSWERKKSCRLQQHGWTWSTFFWKSQLEKDKYLMVSFVCRIIKQTKTSQKQKLEWYLTWAGKEGRIWQYKSVIRISSENLMYIMVIIVNKMVVYAWKFLRADLKHSHHTHTKAIDYVR